MIGAPSLPSSDKTTGGAPSEGKKEHEISDLRKEAPSNKYVYQRDKRRLISGVYVTIDKDVRYVIDDVEASSTLRQEKKGIEGWELDFNVEQVYEISDDESPEKASIYFDAEQRGKKHNSTSNNTLNELGQLKLRDIQTAVSEIEKQLKRPAEFMLEFHRNMYKQYLMELDLGFNLCFYGYGSKHDTIMDFIKESFYDSETSEEVVIINGYYPDLTFRSMVSFICATLDISCNLNESINVIKNYFNDPERKISKLYIVVHNIDGENLRTSTSQNFLMQLAQLPSISLIASIDHIHAYQLWDHNKLLQFQFIFHEMTTMRPYKIETAFETSSLLPIEGIGGGKLSIQSVSQVLLSVPQKSKAIFKKLVELQLENEASEDSFLDKTRFFDNCRRAYLVSNPVGFNAILNEFIDHGLIISGKVDGAAALRIPLKKQLLMEIQGLDF